MGVDAEIKLCGMANSGNYIEKRRQGLVYPICGYRPSKYTSSIVAEG